MTTRPLVRGFAFTAGGSVAVAGVSLVRNVLIARVMGPAAFGLWNLCVVILRLTTESHLGALSALATDAPVHRGAGRLDDARALERRALGLTILLAMTASLIAAATLRLAGGPPLYLAAALLGVTVVLQQQFFADCVVLRTRGIFRRVAIAQIAFAAVHVAGLAALLASHYVTGALAAWSAGLLAAIVVMRVRAREPMPSVRPAGGAGLIVRGVPTYLVGLTFTLLLQADRTIVGAMLGTEALGHYGVTALGASALLLLPDAFGGVLWPLAGQEFGRSGEDPSALSALTVRSFRGLALLSAAGLAATLAGTDVVVATALPNFAPALPALRPCMAGVFLLALTVPLRWLLVTVRAGRAVLLQQTAALVVAALLEIAACVLGFDITGVAFASAGAALLLLVGLLALAASRRLLTSGRAVRLFVEAVLLLAAALALDAALRNASPWLRLAAPVALMALAGASLLRRGARPPVA